VSPDCQEAVTFLKQHTADVLISTKVCKTIDGIPQVEFMKEGSSLLDKMKSMGIVHSSPTHPQVKDLKHCTLPNSGAFQVMVTEIVSPEEVYVQVATAEVGTLLTDD
jgi:hypothetical protein